MNVKLKPRMTSTAPTSPQPSGYDAAGHLREPVVERGEERHHRPAHHDEVEVGDDEVGVVPVDVERHRRERDAGHPAEHQEEQEPDEVGERRLERDGAAVEGRRPVEDLDGGEDAHEHREDPEDAGVPRRLPRGEEVVAPGEEADERDAERGVGDRLVAEDVLVAEGADDLGDHRHRRQHHDVDGGVRVEPEEVLEQHRVAAARRIEDPPAEGVLDEDEQQRHPEHRRREDLDDARRVDRPDEQRQPPPADPGRPHRVGRHDEVEAGEDRREPEDERAEQDGRDLRHGRRRVRRVEGPAGVRAAVEHAPERDHRAEQVEVEAEAGSAAGTPRPSRRA